MLTDSHLQILKRDTTGLTEKYCVTMSKVIEYVKKKAIHKIAYERYDNYAARIIELLHRHSYMEQQQIGDLAIMPVRDARQRLYRLYRDKWVGYLELSKRNDFSPSSTYYFWHLDKPRLELAIIDDMYKTVLNMMIRRVSEMSTCESELNIARNEGHRLGKIFDKIRQLNYSIMKVDQTILLFSRF
jgi:DNA-directed RNA polymerase III subunit RPC3